jgi:hypothetical protein
MRPSEHGCNIGIGMKLIRGRRRRKNRKKKDINTRRKKERMNE